MQYSSIEYILFDAANTIIHKPALWPAMQGVFEKYGYHVTPGKLQLHHKLLSEITVFPDRTSKTFYAGFNAELLLSLGILPEENLLNDLFAACSYLPWQRFEDTGWLNNSALPIGVLSNFNSSLNGILDNLYGNVFSDIIVSEAQQVRKPDAAFFQLALAAIKIPASRILYVGDSLKLDIIPADKLGFSCCLIDRIGLFGEYKKKISTLSDLAGITS